MAEDFKSLLRTTDKTEDPGWETLDDEIEQRKATVAAAQAAAAEAAAAESLRAKTSKKRTVFQQLQEGSPGVGEGKESK